jgi:hypothetical protein
MKNFIITNAHYTASQPALQSDLDLDAYTASKVSAALQAATRIIEIPEIIIPHTSGSGDKNYVGVGIGDNYYGVNGVGDSGGGSITLIPRTGGIGKYWNTERGEVNVLKVRTLTNIKLADLSGLICTVFPVRAYRMSNGSMTSISIATQNFTNAPPPPVIDPVGALSNALSGNDSVGTTIVEPGDANTCWKESDVSSGGGRPIGVNTEGGGQVYYTIAINIFSAAPTKDYRFKVEFEVIDL